MLFKLKKIFDSYRKNVTETVAYMMCHFLTIFQRA